MLLGDSQMLLPGDSQMLLGDSQALPGDMLMPGDNLLELTVDKRKRVDKRLVLGGTLVPLGDSLGLLAGIEQRQGREGILEADRKLEVVPLCQSGKQDQTLELGSDQEPRGSGEDTHGEVGDEGDDEDEEHNEDDDDVDDDDDVHQRVLLKLENEPFLSSCFLRRLLPPV